MAAALLGIAACGGTPAGSPPVPAEAQGTWTFTASVPTPGGGIWVEGSFSAVGDTVLLEVDGASCLPTRGGDDFGYRCPGPFGGSSAQQRVTGATFSFWRHRPAERAHVTIDYLTTTTRRTCASYTTDANGNRTCARWSNEVVEVPGNRSAALKVRPAT